MVYNRMSVDDHEPVRYHDNPLESYGHSVRTDLLRVSGKKPVEMSRRKDRVDLSEVQIDLLCARRAIKRVSLC